MILNTLSCILRPSLGAVLGAVSEPDWGAVLGAVSLSFLLMELPILGRQKVTSVHIVFVSMSTFSPVNRSQE